jgi:hypothetical protein
MYRANYSFIYNNNVLRVCALLIEGGSQRIEKFISEVLGRLVNSSYQCVTSISHSRGTKGNARNRFIL